MIIPKRIYRNKSKEITYPGAVNEVFQRILKVECGIDRDKEHFWSLGLTTRNSIKYIELVSLGSLNSSIVHPREVFRLAIIHAVSSVILIHNHPSGNPDPSEEDLRITRRTADAGRIIGIDVLDHVIIGRNVFVSFKEKGLL